MFCVGGGGRCSVCGGRRVDVLCVCVGGGGGGRCSSIHLSLQLPTSSKGNQVVP